MHAHPCTLRNNYVKCITSFIINTILYIGTPGCIERSVRCDEIIILEHPGVLKEVCGLILLYWDTRVY